MIGLFEAGFILGVITGFCLVALYLFWSEIVKTLRGR